MNCEWEDIPNTTDERGWRRTRCKRCGYETAPWPSGPNARHVKFCQPSIADRIAVAVSAMGVSPGTVKAMAIGFRLAKSMGMSFVVQPHGGTGTILKGLLAGVPGGYALGDCRECEQHRQQMDDWGPSGCRHHLDEIVGWLKQSAELRGLPFVEVAARCLVGRAIRLSSQAESSARKREPPSA
jgi:hypothetical protein